MRRDPSRYRFSVAAAAFCLVAPLIVLAEEPHAVTVKIRPVVLFAGGDVRTTVRTPRDARNRELRIVVEGNDYYASSDVQLDGVDAAATHQFHWKSLPGGAYRVDAILLRADGERTTVTSCFAVLTGDEGDDVPQQPQPRRRGQGQQPAPRRTDVATPNAPSPGC